MSWEHDRKDLIDVQGPPPQDQVEAYYVYGPYEAVQLWVLRPGGPFAAITCYTPTMRCLAWRTRGAAFRYARAMSERARALTRLFGEA